MNAKKFPEIAAKLQKLLKEKGLSKAELSREISIPPPTITRYLNGEMRPEGNNLITLTKFFGVSPEWLYLEDGEEKAKIEIDKQGGNVVLLRDSDKNGKRELEELMNLRDALEGWKGQCQALKAVIHSKDKEITQLQERVALLEKRLKDGTDP